MLRRALPVLLLAAACGSLPRRSIINMRFEPSIDYTKLNTYFWLPRKDSGDEHIDDDRLEKLVEGAVDAALQAKGYKRVDKDGDFAIGYLPILQFVREGVVRWQHEAVPAPGYYGNTYGAGWNVYYWPQSDVKKVEVGTLIIRFHEPKEKKAFWESRLQMEFKPGEKRETATKALEEQIAKMMTEFPPPITG